MGNLQVSAESTGIPPSRERPDSRVQRIGRGIRSGTFFIIYFLYCTCIMGAGQRLVIWPFVTLFPGRRRAVVRSWLHLQARATVGMARWLAGVRLTIHGALPDESCVVVMNHQSVLDIPIGVYLVRGPQPVIPTRTRYRYGIPGISPIGRLSGFPYMSQKRMLPRAELAALETAADATARGEQSIIIFPEGHRTRTGDLGRFMRSGLRIILPRARRPVYCVVADGMAHVRTFAQSFTRFAGSRIRVTIAGPFLPPDDASVDAFIDMLHERMTAALDDLRSDSPTPSRAAGPRAAH